MWQRGAKKRSEGHVCRDGYATAVDLRCLKLHHEIAPAVAVAHALESLVVQHLAEGAQGNGAVDVAIGDKLGLNLRGSEEMHGACLLAGGSGQVEIDVEKLLLGRAVGKLLNIVAELLDLLGGEPIDESLIHQPHCLGIESAVVDGMVEGRVDALDVEGKEAAVARLVGEKLELVARGTV